MRTTSKGLRVAPHQLKFLRKIQKLFQGAAETLSPPCRQTGPLQFIKKSSHRIGRLKSGGV